MAIFNIHKVVSCAGFTLAGILSVQAETNEVVQLPNVIVRADQLQAIPASVTVLSGSRISPGGVEDVGDLSGIAPNVTLFDVDNSRMPRFSVRGLRENSFAAGEPAVGMYVDDVPYLDVDSRGLPLYEVDQVEFIRGPQGTHYGVSAPGGLLAITTRQPGNDWRGYAGASYGNYDSQNYTLGVSGPVVKDKLFLGLAGRYARRDGYVFNDATGTHPDQQKALAGRATLRWTPTEQWDIALNVNGERDDDGFVHTFYPAGDQDFFTVTRDYDGYVDTRSLVESLRAVFKDEHVKFTSVTAHRHWDQDLQQDFDFSAAPFTPGLIFAATAPVPPTLGFTRWDLEQWSQEVRIESPDINERFHWLGGFFYVNKTLETESGSRLPEGLYAPAGPGTFFGQPGTFTDRTRAKFDDQLYALFGEAKVTFDEKFDVLAGVRFEYNQRRISRSLSSDLRAPASYDVDDHFPAVLPKVSLAWHATDKQTVYLNAAAGFQSGGFNASNDDPTQAGYDSSYSWHLELGLNSSWHDGRLSTRAALFYSDFSNYQVYRFNQSNPFLAYLVNADRAYAYGAELEVAAYPTEKLKINLALGVTEAKYDRFDDPVNSQNFDNKHISFVPVFTANLTVEYQFPGGFYVRSEVRGLGDYYMDESNMTRQEAYALLNAQVGWKCKNLEICLFGKNLLDERYDNNALDLRNGSTPAWLIHQPGDPRLFGGAVTARF